MLKGGKSGDGITPAMAMKHGFGTYPAPLTTCVGCILLDHKECKHYRCQVKERKGRPFRRRLLVTHINIKDKDEMIKAFAELYLARHIAWAHK